MAVPRLCALVTNQIHPQTRLNFGLEGAENLQRMLVSVPLTDDERAAVEEGHSALAALIDQLTDVASPSGSTPRAMRSTVTATELPNVRVRPTRRPKKT